MAFKFFTDFVNLNEIPSFSRLREKYFQIPGLFPFSRMAGNPEKAQTLPNIPEFELFLHLGVMK